MNCNSRPVKTINERLTHDTSNARNLLAAAVLVAALVFSTGCVKRVVSSRWFGLRPGPVSQNIQRNANARTHAAKATPAPARPSPDDSLRQVFALQARGAFNPVTDDRRVQLLNTRLRLDPQDVAARLDLAAIYERYGLYEEALEQYTRALNLAGPAQDAAAGVSQPPDAAAVGQRRAEAATAGLARTARAAGHSAEAIPVLAAFLKKSPGAAEVWDELGVLYDEAENRVDAERAFRRAVSLQPRSDRLHNNLGYNLLLQNQLDAAEAEFRRVLQLNPNSAPARNNLGMTLARRGDLDGARRQFLATGDAATAHNNLGVVLMEIGEYEQGRQELVKALQARPYFAPAIENFKLVQELLRGRAEIATAGGSLPLGTVRLPAALAFSAAGTGGGFLPAKEIGTRMEEPEKRP